MQKRDVTPIPLGRSPFAGDWQLERRAKVSSSIFEQAPYTPACGSKAAADLQRSLKFPEQGSGPFLLALDTRGMRDGLMGPFRAG